MHIQTLAIIFYDPERGWVEDTIETSAEGPHSEEQKIILDEE